LLLQYLAEVGFRGFDLRFVGHCCSLLSINWIRNDNHTGCP
jgi:hypothetical protein